MILTFNESEEKASENIVGKVQNAGNLSLPFPLCFPSCQKKNCHLDHI